MRTQNLMVALGVFSVVAVAPAANDFDRIARNILASSAGISPNKVITPKGKFTIYDVAPAYTLANRSGKSPQTVWNLRQRGYEWSQVAQKVGVTPKTFSYLRSQGYFDRDKRWLDWYAKRFNISRTNMNKLRNQGVSLPNVLSAAVIAGTTRNPIDRIWYRYRDIKNWDKVADLYKVDTDQIADRRIG
ncbi:hypothetical protein EON79_06975 [bacterium]|nr:MAG: hypothetical protein EON79_06975 [bacterium]